MRTFRNHRLEILKQLINRYAINFCNVRILFTDKRLTVFVKGDETIADWLNQKRQRLLRVRKIAFNSRVSVNEFRH